MTNQIKSVKKTYLNPLEVEDRKSVGENDVFNQRLAAETEKPKIAPTRQEFTIFSHTADFETRVRPQEISQLLAEIRNEVKSLRAQSQSIASQLSGVEKLTLDNLTDKPGVYHVRFLETIISLLKNLRAKVSEASVWLEAMQSKKAKRGSAFAARSKKQGTAYSQSQEHNIARATQ